MRTAPHTHTRCSISNQCRNVAPTAVYNRRVPDAYAVLKPRKHAISSTAAAISAPIDDSFSLFSSSGILQDHDSMIRLSGSHSRPRIHLLILRNLSLCKVFFVRRILPGLDAFYFWTTRSNIPRELPQATSVLSSLWFSHWSTTLYRV